MKKHYRKLLVLALAAGLLQTGCTNDQVANAIGAVAIVAGAAVIGATTHCEPGYDNVCHSYVDYWGVSHTECEQQYDSCAVLVPNNDMRMEMASDAGVKAPAALAAPASPDAVDTAVNWGRTFDISFASAQEFVDAMKAARAGNLGAVTGLGLTSADIQLLLQKKPPTAAGVNAVAEHLKQSPATIEAMFQQLCTQAAK